MPFCPTCEAEYREGIARCASCDVDLVAQLEAVVGFSEEEVKKLLAGNELVSISRGIMDAIIETRDLLLSKRVPALVVEDEEQLPDPGMPKRMVLVVRKDDLGTASEILGDSFRQLIRREGLTSGVTVQYESCPACGTKVDVEEEECPGCGLRVGKGA